MLENRFMQTLVLDTVLFLTGGVFGLPFSKVTGSTGEFVKHSQKRLNLNFVFLKIDVHFHNNFRQILVEKNKNVKQS